MKQVPLSVIIPTYNRAVLLERSLRSVLLQTTACKEIIVVDDGSTDATKEVVERFASKACYPIHYVFQPNKGPSAARNHGIALAENEYLAFLDSDDHWHKQKIEVQFNALSRNREYRMSHTYETWLRNGIHLNQKKRHVPWHGDVFRQCLALCAIGMSTVLMEKSIFDEIGLFDEEMPCCEDYDFWLRVSCQHHFLLVPERLTTKEGGREDQVSEQHRVGMDRLRIHALQKLVCSGMVSFEQERLTREEIVRKATIFGEGCLKHKQQALGEQYLNIAKTFA